MTTARPATRPATRQAHAAQPARRAAHRVRRAGPARHASQGLGAVSVIVLLVLLSALAAAVLRLATQSASAAQQGWGGAQAQAAARSGIDWGFYQALKGSWTACASASQTLDLRADTGMRVTVSCNRLSYSEGESAPGTPATVQVYTLDAVACNGSAATCPDNSAAARSGYVERRVQASVVN